MEAEGSFKCCRWGCDRHFVLAWNHWNEEGCSSTSEDVDSNMLGSSIHENIIILKCTKNAILEFKVIFVMRTIISGSALIVTNFSNPILNTRLSRKLRIHYINHLC